MKNFLNILHNEWRIMVADRSLFLVSLLLIFLLGYALFIGFTATDVREERIRELAVQQEQKLSATAKQISLIESGREMPTAFSNPLNPALLGSGQGALHAVMPVSPLSPIALGQSDMLPDHYRVSIRNKTTFMYQTENENPWNLLTGRFDPVFVLVYLLPLFIFAVSYNLVSSEKEQGTLRMQLSQPVTLQLLMIAKLTARMVPVMIISILAITLPFLILRGTAVIASDQLLYGLVAVLIVLAYALFWFMLALFINSFGFSSAGNALILVGIWAFLVLVAPVLLNVYVSRVSPAPSRIELATETRLITIDGLNRYQELLSSDYRHVQESSMLLPQDGRFEVPERLQAFYLINKSVDEKVGTLLADFEMRLFAQQDLVERFGFVSPAILAYEGLLSIAGTGTRRYQHFTGQVNEYHQQWKDFFEPRITSGLAMTVADLGKLPRFTWRELDSGVVLIGSLMKALLIFLMVAVLFLLGLHNFAKATDIL